MIHHQPPGAPGWLEAVQKLPDKSLVKTVDGGQVFAEVKGINPNIYTCLRHWFDQGQVFGGTFQENKARARSFFETFIDGTFINQIAPHCDFIEEWNEYNASSHTAAEIEERVRWAKAAAEVWHFEYRTNPALAHIRLVLCNTAIGNFIDRGFAVVAQNYDCLIGYHPYTNWVNKQRVAGDWPHQSGLWNVMEHDWGIKVDWLFTEAGPYAGVVDGWRASGCLGGDRALYVQAVREWIQDVQGTSAYQEGRLYGFALYTTGRAGTTWKNYWTEQPELNELADMIAQEWAPGTVQPGPDPQPPTNGDVDYVVIAHLGPQNLTLEEHHKMVDKAHPRKESVIQSADDAARLVAPGKPGSTVKVWEPDRWTDDIDAWLRAHGVDNIEHLFF